MVCIRRVSSSARVIHQVDIVELPGFISGTKPSLPEFPLHQTDTELSQHLVTEQCGFPGGLMEGKT
jgi:hypothetical protein